jgi:hypothetical protein
LSQENNGMSIASMVLGIISCAIFCFWPLSVPLAIMAIIFGAVGINKGGKGMATAGIVCGIVAVALLLLWVIIVITAGPSLWGPRFWW